ncbi:hypothetical protein [Dokdonia sp. Hel_I_53]|uniref:hypothetical protein n=1 Tax=Dokdonia sp. Hel_I_53 TaxID=1566287 RepID=UPI001199ED01|nr:hypothetical protein [Dokdonia sp. Hel_I_53]TVZ52194.1 hypothetical protein OD90_1364 [Dokdonia sp. Hel_I_53]
MKKVLMAAALFTAITVSAQQNGNRDFAKDLSVEEMATLKTKKMTLALALDEKQSDKVYKLVLNQVKDRKEMMAARKAQGEKPTFNKEEKLARMNARLDKRIAIQKQMKSILTEAQFEEFKKLEKHNRKRGHKRGDRTKKRHSRK